MDETLSDFPLRVERACFYRGWRWPLINRIRWTEISESEWRAQVRQFAAPNTGVDLLRAAAVHGGLVFNSGRVYWRAEIA